MKKNFIKKNLKLRENSRNVNLNFIPLGNRKFKIEESNYMLKNIIHVINKYNELFHIKIYLNNKIKFIEIYNLHNTFIYIIHTYLNKKLQILYNETERMTLICMYDNKKYTIYFNKKYNLKLSELTNIINNFWYELNFNILQYTPDFI